MSQENVERWRAQIEIIRAGTSEIDREEMLTEISELWDPEIEWDTSEGVGRIYSIYLQLRPHRGRLSGCSTP